MKTITQTNKSAGFAIMEGLLILVIVAAIAGVGAYVLHQKHNADATLSSASSTPAQTIAPAGTTASIDQLTQQDAQTEASVDNNSDSQTQQNASSANTSISNVGGAYNENNF